MLSAADVAAIRARADAAPAGPYSVQDGGTDRGDAALWVVASMPSPAGGRVVVAECDADDPPAAAFLAAARSDVPALCDALEEAYALLTVMRRDSDAYAQGKADALRYAALAIGRILDDTATVVPVSQEELAGMFQGLARRCHASAEALLAPAPVGT